MFLHMTIKLLHNLIKSKQCIQKYPWMNHRITSSSANGAQPTKKRGFHNLVKQPACGTLIVCSFGMNLNWLWTESSFWYSRLLEILGTAALENALDSRKINSLLVGQGRYFLRFIPKPCLSAFQKYIVLYIQDARQTLCAAPRARLSHQTPISLGKLIVTFWLRNST